MVAKKREGIVYSTNPDFKFRNDGHSEQETPCPQTSNYFMYGLIQKEEKAKRLR